MSDTTAVAERPQNQVPTAQPQSADSIMQLIREAALNPEMDVEKMERLWAMAERARDKEAERLFNVALSAAQAEVGRVAPNASNKSTGSSYATYAALDKVVRPIYTKHGFALSFDTGDMAGADMVRVLCHVSHTMGHTRTYRADIPCDGKGAKGGDVMTKTHAMGAAFSYGCRYLLKLIFNVAVGEDDDDGNGAGTDTVTSDELDEIHDMLSRCNGDPEKFSKVMKVPHLAAIRRKEMGRVREMLNHAILEWEKTHPRKAGGKK